MHLNKNMQIQYYNRQKQIIKSLLFLFIVCINSISIYAQELYKLPKNVQTAWSSFENPSATKGKGSQANKGAKGHPAETIKPGESKLLLYIQGSGTIQRIWMTVLKRSPQMLQSLRIDMYWDGATKAAVSMPLGDFFGISLGRTVAFQNALFSNPEGRSFNCYIPMPFRKGAKIVLTNESDEDNLLYYDINFIRVNNHAEDVLYFHAFWNNNLHCKLGEDFEILPKVKGKGRFLGCNMGIITDSSYGKSWWGEGEVKMYLDGDSAFPSLVGTGTEDYIGSGWELGTFANLYQGCLIADTIQHQWAFYRYHIPDPIYFMRDCKVTIQQIGMDRTDNVKKMYSNGARLLPVFVLSKGKQINLLDMDAPPNIMDNKFPIGRTMFYRLDNFYSSAYFYLDKPVSNLPALSDIKLRVGKNN